MATSIPYSGGTIVNTTFTGDTRQHIVDGIVSALQSGTPNAGWTVATGSGADITLQSAADAGSRQIRVRLYEPGSGNCAQLFLKNVGATRTSQAYYLLPAAAKTFRIIANQFGFVVLTAGSSAAREFVFCSMLYVPSGITIENNSAFIQGNANADADATLKHSVRTNVGSPVANLHSYFSGLVGDTLFDRSSASPTAFSADVWRFAAIADAVQGSSAAFAYRWHDDSVIVTDALLAFGLTASGEAKVRGIPFNSVIRTDAVAADTTFSYDGHTFYALTNNNVGSSSSYFPGTLCIAVD